MKRSELLAVMPALGSRVDIWLGPLTAAMERYCIETSAQRAAFLAQIAHESDNLRRLSENLNYSAEALLKQFNTPKVTRFTREDAYRYGRTPEHAANQQMIASIAYAGRYGNGPVASGDGWRYRGRGPGQLTFRSNYAKCGAALGIDLLSAPESVERPDVGALTFAWYWAEGNPTGRSLNLLADAGNIDAVSRAVNGWENGLAERRDHFQRALAVLA